MHDPTLILGLAAIALVYLVGIYSPALYRSLTSTKPANAKAQPKPEISPEERTAQKVKQFVQSAQIIARAVKAMNGANDADVEAILSHASMTQMVEISEAIRSSRENIAALDELYVQRINRYAEKIGIRELAPAQSAKNGATAK